MSTRSYQSAEQIHIPQMCRLWRLVFGDSEDYIMQFYRHWFGKAVCLTALDGGQVVGILHLLPVRTADSGRKRLSSYLYACAVLPEFRRQGIFRRMLQTVTEELLHPEELSVILPASEHLFTYYGKAGFQRLPFCSTLTCHAAQDTPYQELLVSELQTPDFVRLRRPLAEQSFLTGWDSTGLSYAITEARFCGGMAKKIICGGREYAMIGFLQNGTLGISELTAQPEEYAALLPALCRTFRCDTVCCRVPYDPALPCRTGMAFTRSGSVPQSIYFPFDFC